MTWKIWTKVLVVSAAVMFSFAPRCLASSLPAVDKAYIARVVTKTDQLSKAAESLQEDVVEEMSAAKEKLLFQKVDQVLLELAKMEKLLESATPAREDLYKQFDSLEGKVTALQKAVPELAPKLPALLRGADRIHALTNDLHFVVSEGDTSPERFRQVLARQAKAMSAASTQLSRTAQYALGDEAGRGELLANMQKLAEASGKFESIAASSTDLEKCRKEFSTLNDAWRQVVEGISLLPSTENVYLLRLAVRADAIHQRLFQVLQIKGKRPELTIRI